MAAIFNGIGNSPVNRYLRELLSPRICAQRPGQNFSVTESSYDWRMVEAEQELPNELSQRAAEALGQLVRIMDDQSAKARDRLRAAQILKLYLVRLERLLESQQTAPDIRKEIREALRKYWHRNR